MPKKRHQPKYSKPPSVAPPSLSISSSSRANQSEHHDRSVNALLADLRRSGLNSNAAPAHAGQIPSVPPSIRQILQLPETPAPTPWRLQRGGLASRRDASGRRLPPGPPPPRSWISLAQSRHTPPELKADEAAARIWYAPIPGAYQPAHGSLVDMMMRRLALSWDEQREWNRFYLYGLPSRVRAALLCYVSELHEGGVSARDLKLILAGPPESELAEYELEKPDSADLNADLFHLDLTGSVGLALSVKELGDLLFPVKKAPVEADLQESWDAPAPALSPAKLLPNLTHLSLAVNPSIQSTVSWRQLAALAPKLSGLTHLNLSGWPEPTLTPNAKFAKVVAPTGQSFQYGGTGPYSHTLDHDWTESILILKRLSKALYSLEYLDFTGCADWFQALMRAPVSELDGFQEEGIDWVGDWGKITTLRLCSGYAVTAESSLTQLQRYYDWLRDATLVEKHIRTKRAGRGRWLSVEKDAMPDGVEVVFGTVTIRRP